MLARERPVPDQRGERRAHDRQRHRHPVPDREPHPGEQVVGQRVAEVALQQRDEQDRDPEPVRELARLAVGAGEEDAEQVEDDRGDEDVGRPVVRLPHQQPGLHGGREVEHRPVGVGHLLALERCVRPVVDRLRRAVLVEERQVDPGRDEDDERVQGHLAEQERPVVREEVAQSLAQERRAAGPAVEEADDPPRHVVGFLARTPQNEGPTGPLKFPAARSSPLGAIRSGNIGSLRPAGPNVTVPPLAGSNVE